MKAYSELSLVRFEFWSGAEQHEFTYNELKELEDQLEELYPEGMSETAVNDLFWFEEETLCEWIGVDYNEYLKR